MPGKGSIFDRVSLRPSQLRSVADRRYADAIALRDTGENERANGAMYLGGFVLELLLKAAMLEEYPWLANAAFPSRRGQADQHLWSLCYRSHDLHEILEKLPKVQSRVSAVGRGQRRLLLNDLKMICGQWTVFVRYSPQSAIMTDAKEFLERIRELKPWVR